MNNNPIRYNDPSGHSIKEDKGEKRAISKR